MNGKYRKTINFDLNIDRLKEYFPQNDYRKSYKDIKKFLIQNEFKYQPDLGYGSKIVLYNLMLQI